MRFFNTGLDPTTLFELWNEEITNAHPAWANLAAYYQMSDGMGTLLTDNSGHSRTGAQNGGMSDLNWVASGAFNGSSPTATPTQTATQPAGSPTDTPTPTPTFTAGPPLSTPTNTPTHTPTFTSQPPLSTPTNTPTNTPTRTPGAGAGYALDFDGLNDYVSLGDTGDLMGGTGWVSSKTLSLWLRPTTQTPPATAPTSGEHIAGTDYPRLFGISRSVYNGQDRIWVWNVDGGTVDKIGVEFTPGEWVNIVLVHSGGMLTAYKNGVLVASIPSGTNPVSNFTSGDGRLFLRHPAVPHRPGTSRLPG